MGEEGPPSLEYIQARDLFPQKELVKEDDALQYCGEKKSNKWSGETAGNRCGGEKSEIHQKDKAMTPIQQGRPETRHRNKSART